MFWRLKFHFFDKHQVSAWLCGTSSLLRLFRTETNSWNCVKISCLPRSGTPGWLLHLNAFTHGSNSVIYLHSNFSDITSLVTNPSLSLSIDLKSASNGVSFKKIVAKFSPNITHLRHLCYSTLPVNSLRESFPSKSLSCSEKNSSTSALKGTPGISNID